MENVRNAECIVRARSAVEHTGRGFTGIFVLVAVLLVAVTADSVRGGENRFGRVTEAEGTATFSSALASCLVDGSAPATMNSLPDGHVVAATNDEEHYRLVLQYYIIRRSDGTGGLKNLFLIKEMMRDLNYGFRDTPIVWVAMPDIIYIDRDSTYNIETLAEALDLYTEFFTPGKLSMFFYPFEDNLLFNNPIARAYTNFGPTWRGHIFADDVGLATGIPFPPHEMGHLIGLFHPWESQFGLECVNGSNCATAGDLLCDTPASIGVFGQNTTSTGNYFADIPGPCPGDSNYAPRTDLWMEFGWGIGAAGHFYRSAFSEGQVNRMLNTLERISSDLIGPDRPDVLVDCDGDLVDDIDEILSGAERDWNRDMIPDDCQVFANAGDLLVSGMHTGTTNVPRYFDGQSGAYRGDLWSGAGWQHQFRHGPEGYVYMTSLRTIQRLSYESGRLVDNFISGKLQGAGTFVDLLFDQNDDILILDNVSRNIRRYSGTDGSYLGLFMHLSTTGMTSPKYMEYGPDGRIYIVGNGAQGNTIQRVDQVTGQALGSFITPGAGGLTAGQGLVFHSDGMLYVSNVPGNNVLRYNGTTGAFVSVFVSSGSGGLSNPHSLRFGPDGHLYIASRNTNSVKRYDGTTGAYMDDFVAAGSGGPRGTGGVLQPTALLFVVEPPLNQLGQCCVDRGGKNPGCLSSATRLQCEAQPGISTFTVGDSCSGDLLADCPCPVAQAPQAELIGGSVSIKNRFLSLSAGSAGSDVAVRVSFVDLPAPFDIWNESEMWVGPTSQVSEKGSSVQPIGGFPNFTAAKLQCAPFYTDWSSLGLIHLFHEGIVPGGTYQVDVIDETCDASVATSFSEPLLMTTAIWGDTVLDLSQTPPLPPEGAVNIVDALGVLGRFSSVPGAIIKARADLEPACLDLKINVTDVLASLAGFVGLDYSFTTSAVDPCASTCPNVLP